MLQGIAVIPILKQLCPAAATLLSEDIFSSPFDFVCSIILAWNVVALFHCPEGTRKIIYTMNAAELLNSIIKKSINSRKAFPNDQFALKVVYLEIQRASQKWTMPLYDWRTVMNRFATAFDGRFS